MLPRFSFELYSDRENIVNLIVEALEIAGRIGARTVSLTGLIPSATDYGCAITEAIVGRQNLYQVAVLKSMDKVVDTLCQGLVELSSAPERLRSLTYFPHLRISC